MMTVIALFVVGIAVGGIVNWLADQLPLLHRNETEDDPVHNAEARAKVLALASLHLPCCVQCGKQRPLSAFLGISAWLTGTRTCAECEHAMSLRYPAAEILTGAILVYVFQRFGVGSTGLALVFYLVLFELIAVIDVEHRYILNIVMFPAFVVALVEVALSRRISLREGLVGYAVGQIALMMVFALGGLYGAIVNRRHQVTNEVAFGFGDVTLATFCGLVVGYPNVVYMLILMVLIGGLIAGGYMVGRIIIARRYQAHMPVAYGPAIVLSAAAMLLWREPIMALIYGPH